MSESWESCFHFAYRYTFFSFLPPFVYPSYRKLGYFIGICSAICFIRALLHLALDNKTDFETYLSVIEFSQAFFNTIMFLFQKRQIADFQNRVSNFLVQNKTNPLFPESTLFIHMWDKSKPQKFTKYLFWSMAVSGTVWLSNVYFKLIFHPEKLTQSPVPYYAPGYTYSLAHKWFYALFDSMFIFVLIAQMIQHDIVIIALLSFLKCRFSYSKNLLDAIFDKNYKKRNDRTNKSWIKNHQEVLSLWYDLTLLLKPHITVNYLSQAGIIVFDVLALMEDNTNMDFMQKVIASSVVIPLLFVLGYQCGLVEEINEIHASMYQGVLKVETIFEGKKETFFLKMLMLRCHRPITISGYGLFQLSRKDFKDLVLRIYQLYSSLLSVKRKH